MRNSIGFTLVVLCSVVFSGKLFASDGALVRAALVSSPMPLLDGVPLGGFGSPARRRNPFSGSLPFATYFKPNEGKLDDPRIKTLLLQIQDKKILFLSLDVVGVSEDFRKELMARISERGFSDNEVFVSATHTHSGPGTLANNRFWEVVAMDKFQPGIYSIMVDQILADLRLAEKNLEPVDLMTSSFHADGLQKNRMIEKAEVDTNAHVLLVRSHRGPWLGGIVNFAIHGTAMGASNLKFSADVPGAIERALERQLSEWNFDSDVTPHVQLINGADGDVAPIKDGYPELVEIGRLFVQQLASHRGFEKIVPSLAVKQTELELGSPSLNARQCVGESAWLKAIVSWIKLPLSSFLPTKIKLWQVRIGDLVMVSWPGEPTTSMGMELRKSLARVGIDRVWVLGLTNEYLAYFTSPEEYARGSYEACFSFYGADAAKNIIDAHVALASKSW